MKKIYNLILVVLICLLPVIKFIPLALTIIVAIVFTIGSAIERIRRDNKVLERNKYLFIGGLYLLIFVVILLFFYLNDLEFYFKAN